MTAVDGQRRPPAVREDTVSPAPGPVLDASLPPAVAARASDIGVGKAHASTLDTFVLAVLAGAFIALGAMFFTVATAGMADVPFGIVRVVGGFVFCLGLVLVVVAGAELFTGNNLIVMAWADRRITFAHLLRNWAIVYAGNLVGALGTAVIVLATRQYEFGDGLVGLNAIAIAERKATMDFSQAFALGILCNALVCLAVWLTYAARSVTDKVVAVLFPITAFVAAGFEHSVANMYFLPIAILVRETAGDDFWSTSGVSPAESTDVTWSAFAANLLPVTLGNVIGGSLLVGAVYWLVYRRARHRARPERV